MANSGSLGKSPYFVVYLNLLNWPRGKMMHVNLVLYKCPEISNDVII